MANWLKIWTAKDATVKSQGVEAYVEKISETSSSSTVLPSVMTHSYRKKTDQTEKILTENICESLFKTN